MFYLSITYKTQLVKSIGKLKDTPHRSLSQFLLQQQAVFLLSQYIAG